MWRARAAEPVLINDRQMTAGVSQGHPMAAECRRRVGREYVGGVAARAQQAGEQHRRRFVELVAPGDAGDKLVVLRRRLAALGAPDPGR